MRTHQIVMVALLAMGLTCGLGLGCSDDDSSTTDDAGVDAGPDVLTFDLREQACPGDPDCPDQGDGAFYAGAVVVDVTPTDLKEGPTFVDNNGNGEYDKNEDEYTDENNNGDFDAVWIAGFGTRPATGIHDPIEARILAMRHNETTVVLVSADFVGFFYDHVMGLQDRLDAATAAEVDKIVFTSTHNHEGPDMVGIWGASFIESGFDPVYMEWVQNEIAAGVSDAVAALEPAHVVHGAIAVQDATGSTEHLLDDSRDPVIMDNQMRVMRFFRPSDDSTIATLINFGNHPEVLWDDNGMLSADFPHYLRDAVEDGIPGLLEGVGGVAIYVQGTCGGLIGPGHVHPINDQGEVVEDRHGWEAVEAFGHRYAEFAVAALDATNGAVVDTDPFLAFASREVFLRVENFNYQAAYRLGIFTRELYNFDPEMSIYEGNIPDVVSDLVYLQVGLSSMVTVPGELAPEIFIGCYDGSCTYGFDFVDPNNPNPPDLSLAPNGPFLKDLLAADGSQFQWLIGLGQDEVGYILPNYDYKLAELSPYVDQADGDHYEETNSLGPACHDQVVTPLAEMIQGQ